MPRIMDMPPLKPGYWWWNIAPLGEKPIWEQRPMPADVSPGNDPPTILGYDTREFMARQYKGRK